MRCGAFPIILLSISLLCGGARGSDSLELPRETEQTPTVKTEEIILGGQKRYRILTEHYDITASRHEDGTLAGEQLEHLLCVWKLLSADFIKETENKPAPPRHRIILYRDKQEYTDNLWRLEPSIARTNGYYSTPRKMAYFFSPEAKVMFHEGTHQILSERFFT